MRSKRAGRTPDQQPDAEGSLLHALHARLRLDSLLRRYPRRLVLGAFMFVGGFLSIALLSALAMVSRTPLVFPSLGPTAFLLFFKPTAAASSPRHCLYGHAIGLACGYGALWCTGLAHAGSAAVMGVTAPRVLAAALALGFTGALLIWCRVEHPPAGATTLIVALGIITSPVHLVMIEVAVALMVALGFALNRLAGVPYPAWEAPPGRPQ